MPRRKGPARFPGKGLVILDFAPDGRRGFVELGWFGSKEGKLLANTAQLAVYDVKGEAVPVEKTASQATIPLDQRRLTLCFAGVAPQMARSLLAKARFEA